jgi:hypothetical protein
MSLHNYIQLVDVQLFPAYKNTLDRLDYRVTSS